MSSTAQKPAQHDLEMVAGDPFTVTITCTGATVTSGTITLLSSAGVAYTAVTPTINTSSSVITVTLSAANTTTLQALASTGQASKLLYSVSGTVSGGGPFELVAGALRVYPVGTSGTSSTSAATLALTTGGAAITLSVGLSAGTAGSVSIVDAGGYYTATTVEGALQELPSQYQPLDSDLTAIAALATTAYGRSLLTQASQSALATLLAADAALTGVFRSWLAMSAPLRSGWWYGPLGYTNGGTVAVSPLSLGFEYAVPIIFGKTGTLDRIGLEITTAVASAVVRLGIRSDSNGEPGALVLDAGTIDASTTGTKTITISQAVTPGIYWLTATNQVATGIAWRGTQLTTSMGRNDGNLTVDYSTGYANGSTGALPGTWTLFGAQSSAPRIAVRAA